jgi:hypothetical protein
MLRNVLLKTIRDQRRSYAAWCAGVVMLVAMYVALWPGIKGQPSMQDFLDHTPLPSGTSSPCRVPTCRPRRATSRSSCCRSWGRSSCCCTRSGSVRRRWPARRTAGLSSSSLPRRHHAAGYSSTRPSPWPWGHWACRPCSALPSSSRATWRRWVCLPAWSPRPCCIWDCSGSSSVPWLWRSVRGLDAPGSAVPFRWSWPCSPTS